MLIKESEYIKILLESIPGEKLKVLNFGSQSKSFIKAQPYIYDNVLKPLQKKGHDIVNLDIVENDGVDIVGDIFNETFFSELKKKHFDVILVFNLLEHVYNLKDFVDRIQDLIPTNKWIVFSGPFKYPIHYDPIDNGFRPSVDEIRSAFSQCEMIKGELIKDYTYSKYLFKSPKTFLTTLLRTLVFFYKYSKWKKVVIPKYIWLFKNYEVTCVLLKKIK